MPEEMKLNRAARDVLAERQRQVTGEGYSLFRDDLYVRGEMAEAAATYASLAGKPGSMSTGWPWGQETFKPSNDRRRDMVFPADAHIVNVANMRHPFFPPGPVSFKWARS